MDKEQQDPFAEFVEVLNHHGVEFVIVGAHAVGWHGYPRGTKDIDFLIRPTEDNAARALGALKDFGFGFLGVTKEDFLSADKVVQLGQAPNRIDLLSSIDAVDSERIWETRVRGSFRGRPVHYIAKDLLIANKLSVDRAQDRLDVQKLQAEPEP